MRLRVAIVFFLAAAVVAAQQAGSLRGTVTDSSGAVIPAADVVVTRDGSRQSRTTESDGSYSFNVLAPGVYRVSVAFPAFNVFDQPIAIDSSASAELSIRLTPASAKQEVSVTEGANEVSVDPSQSAVTTVIGSSDLDALPDDPADLSDMLTQLAGPAAGIGGVAMMVDGFALGQLPPKNTVKEIRIGQNPFSTEYDNLGFGRIEIITKPGTDSLHGNFQLTDSDSLFNSRNPYAANKAAYVNRSFNETLSDSVAHKFSWTVNAVQNKIDTDAIIHAVTLNPSTLAQESVDQSVITPRNVYAGMARVDYQISPGNTATARYSDNRSDQSNNGIGGYSLTDLAYSSETSSHELQLTETAVISRAAVSETHFGFSRFLSSQFGGSSTPAINVAGAFNGGSAQLGNAYDHERDFELQNITTIVHGKHDIRLGGRWQQKRVTDNSPSNFGGTFTFLGMSGAPELDSNNQPIRGTSISISSLEQYRRTLLFQQLGYSPAAIQELGGGASQFSIAGGNPLVQAGYTNWGGFIQDDWKIRPNLTLSPGLRYEFQTSYNGGPNPAPRVALAWSPDGVGGKAAKTVIRLGAGVFYDRLGVGPQIQAERFNGVNERQYLITDPQFFGTVPSLGSLAAAQQTPVTWKVDPKIKPARELNEAVTVERQLPLGSALSVTFIHLDGIHIPAIINANTPYPGTYNPADSSGGVRPYGNGAGDIFEYQSNLVYNRKITIVKDTTKLSKKVSFTVNYTLLFANNDGGWLGTPANPYNLTQGYGRANYDSHNNFNLVGTILAPLGLEFSPIFLAASGMPYNLTTGTDLNGDSFSADRPAFATDLSRPSVVFTRFGAFDTNPTQGQTLVPFNYLNGAGMWNLSARLSRTLAFGPAIGADKRFKLNFNVNVNNVFNHTDPGGYVGNLSSPLFGQSTSLYLFRETSNLRRVQFGTSLSF
jgi:hypothetical protein